LLWACAGAVRHSLIKTGEHNRIRAEIERAGEDFACPGVVIACPDPACSAGTIGGGNGGYLFSLTLLSADCIDGKIESL
jgi:hypothetical protein